MKTKSNWGNMLNEYAMACEKVVKYETAFRCHFEMFCGKHTAERKKEFAFLKKRADEIRTRIEGYRDAMEDAGDTKFVSESRKQLDCIRHPKKREEYFFAFSNFRRNNQDCEIEDYYYNPYLKLMNHEVYVFDNRKDLENELAKDEYLVEITREQAAKIIGDEKYLVEGNYVKEDYNHEYTHRVVDEWKPYIEVRKVDS